MLSLLPPNLSGTEQHQMKMYNGRFDSFSHVSAAPRRETLFTLCATLLLKWHSAMDDYVNGSISSKHNCQTEIMHYAVLPSPNKPRAMICA